MAWVICRGEAHSAGEAGTLWKSTREARPCGDKATNHVAWGLLIEGHPIPLLAQKQAAPGLFSVTSFPYCLHLCLFPRAPQLSEGPPRRLGWQRREGLGLLCCERTLSTLTLQPLAPESTRDHLLGPPSLEEGSSASCRHESLAPLCDFRAPPSPRNQV